MDSGGPAQKGGIKPGDKILEVDGLTTQGGQDVLSILSGEPGETVTMSVLPGMHTKALNVRVNKSPGDYPAVSYWCITHTSIARLFASAELINTIAGRRPMPGGMWGVSADEVDQNPRQVVLTRVATGWAGVVEGISSWWSPARAPDASSAANTSQSTGMTREYAEVLPFCVHVCRCSCARKKKEKKEKKIIKR